MGNAHSCSSAGATAVGCGGGRADPARELLRSAEAGDAAGLAAIVARDARFVLHSSVFGGNTAWHKAAKGGHTNVLEAMRAALAAQLEADSKGVCEPVPPGLLRLGSSADDVVARLVNKANMKGVTPLMLACSGGHTDTVAWLLKNGADVWRHERVRRHTALHCAAEAGATDAVRHLLARIGTDLHPTNGRPLLEQGNHAGLTPLHYAVYAAQHEAVAQLLAADADLTAQAEFPDLDWGCVNAGDTAMHIAAHRGNIEAIQIMLRAYNERSGSLLPSAEAPRRLRDPRAMRNDYGRLPYHLAMRKGLTWLGELLDPSIPVRFLLTGEELSTSTTWGPPRLATIAAAVLHKSLVADLKAIQAALQASGAGAAVADGAQQGQEQQQQQQEQQEQQQEQQQEREPQAEAGGGSSSPGVDGGATSSSAAGGSGGSSGPRRRWGRVGAHQRSASDVSSSWVGRLSDGSLGYRPGSSRRGQGRASGATSPAAGSDGTPAAAAGATRSGRRSSSGSRAARSPALPLTPPERGGLPEALGQLSPRVLLAAFSSRGAAAAGPSAAAAAGDDAVLAGQAVGDGCVPGPSAATASCEAGPELAMQGSPAAASSSWRRLARQVRLGSGRQPQEHLPGCSPEPGCCPGGPDDAAAEDDAPLEPQAESSCLTRSASDSMCLVFVEGTWQLQQPQPQPQLGAAQPAEGDGEAGGGKVSPLPEAAGSRALEALLKQFAEQLSQHSSSVQPDSAPASPSARASPARRGGRPSAADDSSLTCGVCLDATPTARIRPCDHTMCADCALDMCERTPLGTAVCPFCRSIIRGFAPTAAVPAPAAAAATATAVRPPAAPAQHAAVLAQ